MSLVAKLCEARGYAAQPGPLPPAPKVRLLRDPVFQLWLALAAVCGLGELALWVIS